MAQFQRRERRLPSTTVCVLSLEHFFRLERSMSRLIATIIWLPVGSSFFNPQPSTPNGPPAPCPSGIPPTRPTSVWEPDPKTTWQWQLTGTINQNFNVDMYDIDLFDVSTNVIDQLHSAGRKVICYFSAGTYENGRPDNGSFPPSVLGNVLPDWPNERYLDIRNLAVLGPIMEARLQLAMDKGCDGVEPDNVDGYENNSGFPLTFDDQITYNRFLAAEAHERGLSIGIKNDLSQVHCFIDDFDWALNEECYRYNECELLDPFITAGKAVFGVEYLGNPATFCPALNAKQFSWMMKNLELDSTVLADCLDDY